MWKKILDVEHDYFYRCVKFQPEIFCILACVKKTNSDKFELDTVHVSDPEICHFHTGENTQYFGLKFFIVMQHVIVNI